jgi:osmotically inducible lipoprotein OsmB
MRTLARLASLTFAAVALILVGCGSTTEERAATGAIRGAVVGGPVGAAVGAATATVVSKAANELSR